MVQRWDLITIGNLSRNRYWGEGDEAGRRGAMCTCTLLRGAAFNMLVDPSISEEERMAAELDRRSGLKLSDIHLVFLTHGHGDHHFGLRHFPQARWLAAAEVAAGINRSAKYARAVEAVFGKIEGDIDVLSTPGHTMDHHSLRFNCDGRSVVIAGDAAMTRDFWNDRRGYFNSADMTGAAATIERLSEIADIVVPGHDNYFLNER